MSKWSRRKSKRKRWIRKTLINKYGAVCFYCETAFSKMRDITIDHYLPLSKGGVDEIENLRLAHWECNHLKNDMTPTEFEEYQNYAGV